MIAYLRGTILDKQPNLIIVDVQGVGYEVHVPLSTYYDVGDVGADVALESTPTCAKTRFICSGFLTPLEQQLFERLHWDQRYRSKTRGSRFVRHRAWRACGGHSTRRRRTADGHTGHRSQDR